ncbi:MAG: hypothetical protein HYX93_03725 [Chloroflexi bacterium]|nr:hypothetical protein [Chloroflexota bacterium]
MILPALERGGYTYRTQVNIGIRLGGGRHRVDVLANPRHQEQFNILISLKWQQVSGTAEQKVPFEAICLADAILTGDRRYSKAYIVLGGPGWKLRDFYVGGGLRQHLSHAELVEILTLESFVARANQGQL